MHMFKRSSNGLGNSAKCVRCGGIFERFTYSSVSRFAESPWDFQ